MLILKCILNSPQGYDLDKFVKIREVIKYLYCENAGENPLKFEINEQINGLYEACVKCNQYFEKYHLPSEKWLKIQDNCSALCKYLDEFDKSLADFLEKPTYQKFLTQLNTT